MLVKIPYQHLKQVLNLHLQGALGERPLRFTQTPVYKHKKIGIKLRRLQLLSYFFVLFSAIFPNFWHFLRGQPKSAKKYEKYETRTKSMKKYDD